MRFIVIILLVLVSFAALSQDFPATVATKFNAYKQRHQSLKTAIAFSQDKYMPGDTAFFNAWFMTEGGQFIAGDQILNLDMINPEGKVVQQIRFRIKNGIGANQLIIDPNTTQGSYVMCVYNDVMKDDDPKYAYRKNITVVKRNVLETRSQSRNEAPRLIEINDSSNDNLVVTARIPGFREKEMVLAVTSGGLLYFTAGFSFNRNDAVSIKLPRKDLPEGWISLAIISKDATVVASRNFFIKSSINCVIKTLRDTIQSRTDVLTEIKVSDADGKALSVPVTVSILNGNLAVDAESYELNEPPVVPWSDVLYGKVPEPLRPSKLITLYGEIYFADTNQPVPVNSMIYGFMKKNRFPFEAEVMEAGKVEMIFLDFFGDDNMFYFVEHEGKGLRDAKIRWVSKDISHAPSLAMNETGQSDNYAAFIEKKKIVDRSFNFFLNAGRDTVKTSIIPLEMEFEKLGSVVNFNEYKIFPTMSETIREIVPKLGERKVDGENIVRVDLGGIDQQGYAFKASGNPMFIIDGALTRNSQYLLSLDPANVVSIRVVYDPAELKKFLPVAKNGVVIVKTKSGLAKRDVKDESLPVSGLSKPITFVPINNDKPEFRSTVAWLPSLKTDTNGLAAFSFKSSDDTGKMKIRVTGIYAGEVFTAEKEIFVKFSASH